jgi:hypothetical protein
MEAPTIPGALQLFGVVYGDSGLELGKNAAELAHKFFGHYSFTLDIRAEWDHPHERFRGEFTATHT